MAILIGGNGRVIESLKAGADWVRNHTETQSELEYNHGEILLKVLEAEVGLVVPWENS